MVKNVAIKKFLKGTIFKIASLINAVLPKDDNIILLYSANKGIQHSLLPMRDYLIQNGYHKKYRIICGIEEMKYKDDCGLEFMGRLDAYRVFFKVKHVFYSAGQIPIKPSKNQLVIHLRHGNTNFKKSGNLTNINNGDEFYFTYMAASAPMFKPIMAEEYKCREENIAVVGDPMIDMLFNKPSKLYDFSKYRKVILWLPTFRQSDYLGYNDSMMESLVPMFCENEYEELNTLLENYNIKLIVKIHPAQNNIGTSKRHFSHFEIYTNEEFVNSGYNLWSFMSRADALIGDYSSASMQYLVLDRPQAFVIPDIEEYSRKRGFIFKDPEEYMGGHIIKNKAQFKTFIDDIFHDKDVYKEKRRNICKKVYLYTDNRNCERVAELSGLKL